VTVDSWLAALDHRHLADLSSSEVTRALRALSSCYVERREKLAGGGALDGAGKRAAFALFYGPQHFFIAREVLRAVKAEAGPAESRTFNRVIDLGCGTGTAGAAVALEAAVARIDGFDLNPWAVHEANWTYRTLGLRGKARIANITKTKIRFPAGSLVLAAYTVNELQAEARTPLLEQLKAAHAHGSAVLVIEPIGRRINVWWDRWAEALIAAGGRQNDWRFRMTLPPRQRSLAKAAGLNVEEQTARSLYLPHPA
jgi:hypothetical protein